MVDHDVRLEALSALLGAKFKRAQKFPSKYGSNPMTIDDFFINAVIGNSANDRGSSSDYTCQSVKSLVTKFEGLNSVKKEFFVDAEEFFDPGYDFDFRDLSPTSVPCRRGGETYNRPQGWYRMALKVRNKYPDGNTWLGPQGWRDQSVQGEWPVSFHGTSVAGAKGIITSHYKTGGGAAYGRGIYSTPSLEIADGYATSFKSQKTGKSYRVIMQNRINPAARDVCKFSEYWLISVPCGTSPQQEREIVERSIRPYGILIQEVTGAHASSSD